MFVVSHYNEDLTWLFELVEANDDESDSGFRAWSATVYMKQAEAAIALERDVADRGLVLDANAPGLVHISVVREPENWGDEAVPYLRFITTHYEALPPLIAFVHGSPREHSPFLSHMIECMQPQYDGYFSIGNPFLTNNGPTASHLFDPLATHFNGKLAALGLADLGPAATSNVSYYGAAQFIVSRAAVRRRPLAYWKALLATALEVRQWKVENLYGERAGKISAYWLEFGWHEHFTKRHGEEWRSYEETCGANDSTTVPLLRACCEDVRHIELLTMLKSDIVQRVVGGRVWLRHRAHPPKGNE